MTYLDTDVYLPKGLHSSDTRDIPIIFDIGCYMAISPSKVDFGDSLVPSNKTMLCLGSIVRVKGEVAV